MPKALPYTIYIFTHEKVLQLLHTVLTEQGDRHTAVICRSILDKSRHHTLPNILHTYTYIYKPIKHVQLITMNTCLISPRQKL